jgi:hypothetical protein
MQVAVRLFSMLGQERDGIVGCRDIRMSELITAVCDCKSLGKIDMVQKLEVIY